MSDLPHDADVRVTVYFCRPTVDKKGYISAYITSSKLEGEDWNRGGDLSDGDWSQETIDRVKRDIDRIFANRNKKENNKCACG